MVYPPLSYFGSKRKIAPMIIKLFPPHRIYVEPFFGGGSIFWFKPPSELEVINDSNKELMNFYKLLKVVSSNPDDYNLKNNIDDIQKFVNQKHTKKEDIFLSFMYQKNNSFFGKGDGKIFREESQISKIKNLPFYKERLKKTKILNTDYKVVVKQYDSKHTLFYLDPPYENTIKSYYGTDSFDYIELAEILNKIQGKFILSLNDSKNIRDIFRNFNIFKLNVQSEIYWGLNQRGKSQDIRKELIITNFE